MQASQRVHVATKPTSGSAQGGRKKRRAALLARKKLRRDKLTDASTGSLAFLPKVSRRMLFDSCPAYIDGGQFPTILLAIGEHAYMRAISERTVTGHGAGVESFSEFRYKAY
jgi:hypothetical protein